VPAELVKGRPGTPIYTVACHIIETLPDLTPSGRVFFIVRVYALTLHAQLVFPAINFMP
jgi:hypothetical protein